MKRSLFVAAAVVLGLAACKSSFGDIPTSIPLGVITVAMQDAPAGVHSTSPAAYFVDAVNVGIPNSSTSADTCAQLAFPGAINDGAAHADRCRHAGDRPHEQPRDARHRVAHAAAGRHATATSSIGCRQRQHRRSSGPRRGMCSSPGASNGFNAQFKDVRQRGLAQAFTPIDATPDSTGDLHAHLESAGRSARIGRRAARVLRQPAPGLANTQIFCQFTDNGAHQVEGEPRESVAEWQLRSTCTRIAFSRRSRTTAPIEVDMVSQYTH